MVDMYINVIYKCFKYVMYIKDVYIYENFNVKNMKIFFNTKVQLLFNRKIKFFSFNEFYFFFWP